MTKITGLLHEFKEVDRCYLRMKPSAPWLSVSSAFRLFEVNKGLVSIDIEATPTDRVWRVEFLPTLILADVPKFNPTESWIVPIEDCDISEIRNLSLTYVKGIERECDRLKSKVNDLNKEISLIKEKSLILRKENKKLKNLINDLNKEIFLIKEKSLILSEGLNKAKEFLHNNKEDGSKGKKSEKKTSAKIAADAVQSLS
jgi:hypothetical protein